MEKGISSGVNLSAVIYLVLLESASGLASASALLA